MSRRNSVRVCSFSAVVFIALLSSGCVSWITVEKAGPKVLGFRYSLPQTFLFVKPGADGGITVEDVYLPDPNNEYAVRAVSFLSVDQFDMTIENGLLKKAIYNSNTAAIASQLAASAGAIGQTHLQTSAAAQKAEAAKAAAALQAKVAAEQQLEAAKEELAALEKEGLPATDPRLINARLAIARAETALRQKAAVLSGFNAPDDPQERPELPSAWGPVLFQVVEDEGTDGVRLVLVEPQMRFETYKPTVKVPAPTDPRIRLSGSPVVRPNDKGHLTLAVASDLALRSLDPGGHKLLVIPSGKDLATSNPVRMALQPDGKIVLVELDRGTPDGDYWLWIAVNYGTDAAPKATVGKVQIAVAR